MVSVTHRIYHVVRAVDSVFRDMKKSYIPLDQSTQYLILSSPVLAEYKNKFRRPEEKKVEKKALKDYKDLTEEDALKCIKERNANMTLDKAQKD